jgi:hypothetical protein
VLQTVYQFGYTLYGFIFGVDTGAKELYVQTENSGLLSFGLSNKSLYVETEQEDMTCYIGVTDKSLYVEINEV